MMTEHNSNRFSISDLISTGKELVAMLRDAMLLMLVVLLLVWPQTIKSVLVAAGFKKGSIAGLEWEANLALSDEALIKAQSTIADLINQNNELNKILSEIKLQKNEETLKENLAKIAQFNAQLVDNAEKVQASVAANITANSPIVREIHTSIDKPVTWGVVFGADQKFEAAVYEINTIAPKLGLVNAAIYYRQGTFRSVATTIDRLQASQLLNKAIERRKDAYIVNMSTWCPDAIHNDGYFKCSEAQK